MCIRDRYQRRVHGADFFKTTKVNSCSFVKMQGGKAVAAPYHPPKKINWADKIAPSSEVNSFTRDAYKVKANLHAGMAKKPLEPYNPNSCLLYTSPSPRDS
eukprot:TRINITY_DN6629_c0_g1_i4.p5 TRINITY_DN6629_c0_g1~~TRINITY_DN6629_c0_g1_i4.p5  ORF type:complete len:101 (+),score=38.68 TRINITY_DN6629_c0_g1_i4:1-303(+)